MEVREYYGMVLRETCTPMMSPNQQGSGMPEPIRANVEASKRDVSLLRLSDVARHLGQ